MNTEKTHCDLSEENLDFLFGMVDYYYGDDNNADDMSMTMEMDGGDDEGDDDVFENVLNSCNFCQSKQPVPGHNNLVSVGDISVKRNENKENNDLLSVDRNNNSSNSFSATATATATTTTTNSNNIFNGSTRSAGSSTSSINDELTIAASRTFLNISNNNNNNNTNNNTVSTSFDDLNFTDGGISRVNGSNNNDGSSSSSSSNQKMKVPPFHSCQRNSSSSSRSTSSSSNNDAGSGSSRNSSCSSYTGYVATNNNNTSSSSDGSSNEVMSAYMEACRSGRLTPILKEELKFFIQARRLSQGKEEMEVQFLPPSPSQLSAKEMEKIERRKKQNRQAAKRFRQKQKGCEGVLIQRIKELETVNAALHEEAQVLRGEREKLMEVMAEHLLVCPYFSQNRPTILLDEQLVV